MTSFHHFHVKIIQLSRSGNRRMDLLFEYVRIGQWAYYRVGLFLEAPVQVFDDTLIAELVISVCMEVYNSGTCKQYNWLIYCIQYYFKLLSDILTHSYLMYIIYQNKSELKEKVCYKIRVRMPKNAAYGI